MNANYPNQIWTSKLPWGRECKKPEKWTPFQPTLVPFNVRLFHKCISRRSLYFLLQVVFLKSLSFGWSSTSVTSKEKNKPDNTYYLRESITVRLTSCLFCLYSAALLILNLQQLCLFGQIQTSQTWGQPYSDTSVSEYARIIWYHIIDIKWSRPLIEPCLRPCWQH